MRSRAGITEGVALITSMLDLAGDEQAARSPVEMAARRTLSIPEQRYLEGRAAELAPRGG